MSQARSKQAALGTVIIVALAMVLFLAGRPEPAPASPVAADTSVRESPAHSKQAPQPVVAEMAAATLRPPADEVAAPPLEESPASVAEADEPEIAACPEECPHCANQLKLVASQTAYAEQAYAGILATHRPEASQVDALKLACRQLADAVMLEWSPENNAPVLQAEETIAALRKEMIDPLLAEVPRK